MVKEVDRISNIYVQQIWYKVYQYQRLIHESGLKELHFDGLPFERPSAPQIYRDAGQLIKVAERYPVITSKIVNGEY